MDVQPGRRSEGRAGGPARLQHLPPLDGLRGLAVLGVVLYHAGVAALGGGFLGVDLFFVLSGYLITSLLLAEWGATGRIDFAAFWERRARRLLPALVVVLVAVAVLARLFGDDGPTTGRGDVLATLLYVQNWHLLTGGSGYFEQGALPSALQHAWSLSIEEQFYLAWPVLLGIGVLRARRWATAAPAAQVRTRRLRRALLLALGGALVSAVLLAVLADADGDPSRAYYGTDTRASGLLLGAALAAALQLRALRERPRPAGSLTGLAGWLGLAVLAVLWVRGRGDAGWLYRGGMVAGELAAVLLLAAVTLRPGDALARLLSWRPLRALGTISYGVYLWHWPLFQLLTTARTGLRGPLLLAVRLAVVLAVAVASYRLVERPVRRGGSVPAAARAVRGRPAALAAVATVLLLAAVPAATAVAIAPPATLAAALDEGAADAEEPDGDPGRAPAADPGATAPAPTRAARTAARRKDGVAREVLVAGDSVGKSLAAGLTAYLAGTPLHLTDAAVLGCGITIGGPYHYSGQLRRQGNHCPPWESRWRAKVAASKPDVAVLLVGRWEVMDRVFRGRWTHIGDPEYDAYLQGQLRTALRILGSTGARVVVVTAPYYRRGEQPDGEPWPEDVPGRTDRWNALVRATAAPAGASVLDLDRLAGPDGHYEEVVAGVRLRYDGVHLRSEAVKALGPWLLPRILGPLKTPRR